MHPQGYHEAADQAGTSPVEQLNRIRVLFKVYDGELPGDLASAAQYRSSYADLWHSHPLLWSFVLRGKEGPWHDALLRTARDAFGASGASMLHRNEAACCQFTDLLNPDATVASRAAQDFHELLATAAGKMDGVDRSVWTAQVSANVAHHSGWVALLRFYKVLDTASDKAAAPLSFRVGGAPAMRSDYYRMLPYKNKVHLELYVSTARIVELLRMIPLPTSLRDWSGKDQQLVETSVSFERILKCLWFLGKFRIPMLHSFRRLTSQIPVQLAHTSSGNCALMIWY